MNIVSHIIYPVIAAQTANVYRVCRDKPSYFTGKQLLLIGLCGGLPDILSPHLRLTARYQSASHSLGFLIFALLASVLLSIIFRKYQKLILFCFFAIALHLVCDMVAGGINLYAPFGRMIVGKYFIPPRYWIALDLLGILLLVVLSLYYERKIHGKR
jgi:hypothetical protein